MNARNSTSQLMTMAVTALSALALTMNTAPAAAAPPPAAPAKPPTAAPARETKGAATSVQPRLLGSQPADNGEMVGNSIAMLFTGIEPGNGTPPVEVFDEQARKPIQTKVNLTCNGTGRSRRCMVLVTLLETEVGHRYRITCAGVVMTVRAAPGHPGDRKR